MGYICTVGDYIEKTNNYCIQLLSMNQSATGYQMVTPRQTERKDFFPIAHVYTPVDILVDTIHARIFLCEEFFRSSLKLIAQSQIIFMIF